MLQVLGKSVTKKLSASLVSGGKMNPESIIVKAMDGPGEPPK